MAQFINKFKFGTNLSYLNVDKDRCVLNPQTGNFSKKKDPQQMILIYKNSYSGQ